MVDLAFNLRASPSLKASIMDNAMHGISVGSNPKIPNFGLRSCQTWQKSNFKPYRIIPQKPQRSSYAQKNWPNPKLLLAEPSVSSKK